MFQAKDTQSGSIYSVLTLIIKGPYQEILLWTRVSVQLLKIHAGHAAASTTPVLLAESHHFQGDFAVKSKKYDFYVFLPASNAGEEAGSSLFAGCSVIVNQQLKASGKHFSKTPTIILAGAFRPAGDII
jgi:hypothetical protein